MGVGPSFCVVTQMRVRATMVHTGWWDYGIVEGVQVTRHLGGRLVPAVWSPCRATHTDRDSTGQPSTVGPQTGHCHSCG